MRLVNIVLATVLSAASLSQTSCRVFEDFGPDLTLHSSRLDQNYSYFTVINQGHEDAQPVEIAFGHSDLPLEQLTIKSYESPLAPRDTTTFVFYTPKSIGIGLDLRYVIDPFNKVLETNEKNNEKYKHFSMQVSKTLKTQYNSF